MDIKAVFHEVWDEFYTKSTTTSEQLLQELRAATSNTPLDFGLDIDTPRELFGGLTADEDGSQEVFIEYTLSDFHGVPSTSAIAEMPIVPEDPFVQSPRYESCGPAPRNIRHGDDPNSAPYVPFADDPTFNVKPYVSEYVSFKWQQRSHIRSSDAMWISLEVARRMIKDYGMSLHGGDGTTTLPHYFLSMLSSCGKGWKSLVTSCPPWMQLHLDAYEKLIPTHIPAADDLSSRIKIPLSVFCSNLNCIEAYCWLHDSEIHDFENDPRYNPSTPIHTPRSSKPCSKTCYLLSKYKGRKGPALTERDTANLEIIFKLFPEGSICELSTLMRLPCCQVHDSRELYVSRIRSRSVQQQSPAISANVPGRELDTAHDNQFQPSRTSDHERFIQFEPCSHKEPCDVADCSCDVNHIYCERTCCCPLDCPRRWRGCNCAMARGRKLNVCMTGSSCPCRKNGRECDPEVCDCFHCPQLDVACKNSGLRHEWAKKIAVTPSSWGFGAFLEEPVRKEEFVCEYTGELIYEDTTGTRDFIAKHRGRAYVYRFNDTFDVDASYAGNASRFINHAPSKQANCFTRIKNISGDHRIGVYAKRWLAQGTELTIDYGNEFFGPVSLRPPSKRPAEPSSSLIRDEQENAEGDSH